MRPSISINIQSFEGRIVAAYEPNGPAAQLFRASAQQRPNCTENCLVLLLTLYEDPA